MATEAIILVEVDNMLHNRCINNINNMVDHNIMSKVTSINNIMPRRERLL